MAESKPLSPWEVTAVVLDPQPDTYDPSLPGTRPVNPLADRDAILLALDGVLFRTDDIHQQTYGRVLGAVGIEEFDYTLYAGRCAREIIRTELDRNDIVITAAELLRLTADKRELAYRQTVLGVRAVEGARTFLSMAHDAGFRTAVVTSGNPERVFTSIENARMDRWIDTVVTLRCGGQPKPAPDLYIEALHRLGVPKERAIAIEDAGVGIRGARAAGVDALAIVTGSVGKIRTIPHDVPLTSFPDLTEYLARCGA